ncbi:hypothetical protein GOODEAATRI_024944, partial [Goodea atripinnis]
MQVARCLMLIIWELLHKFKCNKYIIDCPCLQVFNLFCKLAALVRHRISLIGDEACAVTNCLRILAQALDARILMASASESIQTSLHSFFEAATADLEMSVEKISETSPQSRGQLSRGVVIFLNYTTSILIPTLTSLFHHLGNQNYGVDVLVGGIQ